MRNYDAVLSKACSLMVTNESKHCYDKCAKDILKRVRKCYCKSNHTMKDFILSTITSTMKIIVLKVDDWDKIIKLIIELILALYNRACTI